LTESEYRQVLHSAGFVLTRGADPLGAEHPSSDRGLKRRMADHVRGAEKIALPRETARQPSLKLDVDEP
jgi:hypothetical protein